MTEDTNSKLHKMKLHETLQIEDFFILRVPGGWVYTFPDYSGGQSSTFIPFSREFSEK